MNRRHLLCSLMTVGAAGCQHSPSSGANGADRASHPMTPATQARLEKTGIPRCTRVAAYVINKDIPSPAPNLTLVIDGKMNPDRTPLQGVTLDDARVKAFLDATTVKEFSGGPSYCFMPHHAFAFYQADGILIAHYNVCFTCRTYVASKGTFVSAPDYRALKRLFDQLKLPDVRKRKVHI